MSISDAELARVRGTSSYRVALWVSRFGCLTAVALVWVLLSGRPQVVMIGVLLLPPVAMLCSRVLLRRAGMPLTPGPWGDVANKAMRKQWSRDLLWYRRP